MESAQITEDPGSADHLNPQWPLDRAVGSLRDVSGPWWLAASGFLAGMAMALVVIAVALAVFGLSHGADARAGYSLFGEAVFGVGVFACAWPVARRAGGWNATFGLTAPEHGQGRTIAKWVGLQFAIRIALGVLLLSAVPYLRHRQLGNLTGIGDLHVGGAALLLLAAVLLAPVVEELAFRGALLRALMRRFGFWPSAVASSILFGLLHVGTVNSWAAAVFTLPSLAVFGLLQCMLVRRRGDLGAAIGVHATTNLIALSLSLLTSHAATT